VTRDGRVLDTLMVLSMVNSTMEIRPPGGERGSPVYASQPLGDDDLWDISSVGDALATVRRSVEASEAPSFVVTRLSARGDTIFSRRYRYPPRSVPRRLVDSLTEKWAGIAAGRLTPSRARAVQAVRAALYVPDHLPPVTAVVAGRDGTTWLRREETGDRQAVWNVLDLRGNVVAVVSVPRGLRVREAQMGMIWGTETDADELPVVSRYRVQAVRSGR
jgi:hypothetical protein